MTTKEIKAAGITTLSEHLQVVTIENDKIVFAHGINIGYIREDILYVKKDYYSNPKGAKNTIFMDQYFTILVQTFQLQGHTTEERVVAIERSAVELNSIREAMKGEKDAVKAKAMYDQAIAIGKEFANATNVEIIGDINSLYNKLSAAPAAAVASVVVPPVAKATPASPDAALAASKAPVKLTLLQINDLIKEAKTKKIANDLWKQAKAMNDANDALPKKEQDKQLSKDFTKVKRTWSNK